MFKVKSSKKRIVTNPNAKDASTLDARHQQILNDMQEKRHRLTEWVGLRENLTLDLSTWNQRITDMQADDLLDTPEYDEAWSSNLHIKKLIKDIDTQIDKLEQCTEEIEYFENTANILFEYYELIDSQCDITPTPIRAEPPRSAASKGRRKALPVVASKSILEALQIEPPQHEPSTPVDKSSLVDDFMVATDPTFIKGGSTETSGICESCKIPLVCLQQDGIIICQQCGYQELLLVEQNRPILRMPSAKEASHFSYKRINHFKEWIAQIQGKESTDIPEDVFEHILAEIRKEKIYEPKTITYTKMREILKRLRINKYYEHIAYIIHRITGTQPPHFTPELEDKLCAMFKEIQGPFLKHCPPSRKNFLSYSYVLRKLMEQLGMEEYIDLFPLLRSREKLYIQDQIYSNICADLGWSFKPSL
jgi:uncharacterized Zn finger protein (UPF0148 family)